MDSFARLLPLTGYQLIRFTGYSKIGRESYGSEHGRGLTGWFATALGISPWCPKRLGFLSERLAMADSSSMRTERPHFASTLLTLIRLRNSLLTTWWKPNRGICGL